MRGAGRVATVVDWTSDLETLLGLRDRFLMDLRYREDWLPVFLDYLTDVTADDMCVAAVARADIVGIGRKLGSQRGLPIGPVQ